MRPLTFPFFAWLLASIAALSGGQTNLMGYWVFRVPRDNNDGTFQESFFELKQEGEAVTGRALNWTQKNPVLEGTFRDDSLHFVVSSPGRGGGTIRIVFEGKLVEGGKFAMTATGRDANAKNGEFVRSTKEAALPPTPPPLPTLRDVRDNGLARTPPMGWNSWNKLHRYVTDADVRAMADAMIASGMAKVGYMYVNIDDTWQGQSRDAKGNITTNKKFPDMKALANYVHSKGLKIGIYSSPGPKTCEGYEGSYGHEEQDAKQFAIWGFDYLKYDWCSAENIYRDEDMQAVYQKMGDALLKAGRPMVYSLCQYGRSEVWQWGAKVGANLWRTTGDIADHWTSLDQIGFGTRVPGQDTQLDIASFTRPGHFNDPDMLEIGNGGMTDDEYRVHMTLWSLLSAPLLAGNDLRAMTDETKSILLNTEAIAVDQDKAVNPPTRISEPGSGDNAAASLLLAKTLSDGSIAVGMFNRGEQPLPMSITWESLGITGKTVQARDLWTHKSVEVSADGYTANVPKHGVVMLKVSVK